MSENIAKARKLFAGVTGIDDELIYRALELDDRAEMKRKRVRFTAFGVAAAAAVVVTGAGLGKALAPENLLMVAAAQLPNGTIYETLDYDERVSVIDNARESGEELTDFYSDTVRTFLAGGEGNRVFSPACVYNELSMAAEITDGNTRAQILELLDVQDIGTLRTQTRNLWLTDYRPSSKGRVVTASSLWLNESIPYKRDVLDILTQDYFASVFSGKMGSDRYDRALSGWINGQTGGLLKKYSDRLTMEVPEGYDVGILELVSTVYFNAGWSNEFIVKNTQPYTFHAPDRDVTCDFMKNTFTGAYFWGEKFSGCVLGFKENGATMRLILPDEGYDTDDLLNDPEAMTYISDGTKFNGDYVQVSDTSGCKHLEIDLALPKFDISENVDLRAGLKDLGVTDIFDMFKANFSPLTDMEYVAAARMTTASRVMIDEEGCRAASYVEMNFNAGAAMPPDDHAELKLDRPFIFTIFTLWGQPLFCGVVRDPTITD